MKFVTLNVNEPEKIAELQSHSMTHWKFIEDEDNE